MAEATNDVIVEMLKPIQSDMSELTADPRGAWGRVGHIAVQLASQETRFADPSARMDRRDDMMERVFGRLELTDASH